MSSIISHIATVKHFQLFQYPFVLVELVQASIPSCSHVNSMLALRQSSLIHSIRTWHMVEALQYQADLCLYLSILSKLLQLFSFSPSVSSRGLCYSRVSPREIRKKIRYASFPTRLFGH